MVVNRNAKTGNFGRTYVAVSTRGTQPIGGSSSYGLGNRIIARGMFAVNADGSDAVGQGDTSRTCGMTFDTTTTTYSPYRLAVGPDDMVYICDAGGINVGGSPTNGVYMAPPDLSSGTNLFPIDGTVPEVCGGVQGRLRGRSTRRDFGPL